VEGGVEGRVSARHCELNLWYSLMISGTAWCCMDGLVWAQLYLLQYERKMHQACRVLKRSATAYKVVLLGLSS